MAAQDRTPSTVDPIGHGAADRIGNADRFDYDANDNMMVRNNGSGAGVSDRMGGKRRDRNFASTGNSGSDCAGKLGRGNTIGFPIAPLSAPVLGSAVWRGGAVAVETAQTQTPARMNIQPKRLRRRWNPGRRNPVARPSLSRSGDQR